MSKKITSASEFDALVDASDRKPVFLKCYMNGCPHCEHMVDAWNKMAQQVKSKGLNVQVAEIEQGVISSIKSKHADILKVDGFPTLICITNKGKRTVKHDGERTAEALLQFIEQQSKKQAGGQRGGKSRKLHRRSRKVSRKVSRHSSRRSTKKRLTGGRCCKCAGGRGNWGTACYDDPSKCCKKK